MYSQNNEETFITNHFSNRKGKLLDIGAYDGRTFSNTLALLESGWEGVLIEASPSVFTKLIENVSHLNVKLINTAIVCDIEGLVTFYNNDGAVATMDQENLRKWQRQEKFYPISVMTCNIDRLAEYVGTKFDFINIDVEGQSAALFIEAYSLFPDCDMWVVEHDDLQASIIGAAVNHKVIHQNGENLILVRK
jgi:FkbM family methyltransferase